MAALFELFATLGLDTTEFDADVKAAQKEAKQLESDIEAVDNAKIDFDKQRRELERDFKDMTEAVEDLNGELRKTGKAADSLDELGDAATDVSGKGAVLQGVFSGLVQTGIELVGEALKSMGEFAAQSLEFVAQGGSDVSDELKRSNAEWEYSERVLMRRVGESVAPAVVALRGVADSLLGISRMDKASEVLKTIDALRFQHIELLKENLRDVFGLFEVAENKWDDVPTIQELMDGLGSQAVYWQNYGEIVNDLITRGLNTELLSRVATGSPDDMPYLLTLQRATDEELNALNIRYGTLKQLRDEAATVLGDETYRLENDVKEAEHVLAGLVYTMSRNDTYEYSVDLARGILEGFRSQSPEIKGAIDDVWNFIADKPDILWKVTVHTEMVPTDLPAIPTQVESALEGAGLTPQAKGLSYVPFNDFPASLHVGEAVLTRQQADQWRAGRSDGAGQLGEILPELVDALHELRGLSVAMDGRTVGHLVSGTVSHEIGRNMNRRLNRT